MEVERRHETGRAIRTVLILGFGLMGRGVARSFAAAGFRTRVASRRAGKLDKVPEGIEVLADLPDDCPDLVLELVPEDLETKRAVFREVERKYRDAEFLLATGTSGLDLNELAAGLARPERLIAIHYYMPAESIRIVEVAAGPATPPEAVDRAAEALERCGKLPLRMYKPVIGFVANRLQHAILHEAYWMITNGFATAQDIDFAAVHMLGPRMCTSGLILQKDISGLKVNADVQRAIVPHLFHNNTPNPLPGSLVERGETGLVAGKGFYDWGSLDAAEVRRAAADALEKLLRFLERDLLSDAAQLEPKARTLTERR